MAAVIGLQQRLLGLSDGIEMDLFDVSIPQTLAILHLCCCQI